MEKLVVAGNLTSEVYTSKNPPKDWADIGLLFPHEPIRRDMLALQTSLDALQEDGDSWRALYFCKWIVDYFCINIHEHHDNEEIIYFPWLATRADIPDKEYAVSHEELMGQLGILKENAETVVRKKGRDSAKEIAAMKQLVPKFVQQVKDHLKEEEATIPAILRANFTQEEDDAAVEKIIQKGGLLLARIEVPPMIQALREWGTPELLEQFYAKMPPPIVHLVKNYFIPDYENYVLPLRDAPTLTDVGGTPPPLKKTPCCLIPGCFPCIF